MADGRYICGVNLRTDQGNSIMNWPERLLDDSHWPSQHYENGLAKNDKTMRRYRGQVRILKKLRFLMADSRIKEAEEVEGFLVECMVYNSPDQALFLDSWHARTVAALSFLAGKTADDDQCQEWREVSELKWLFKTELGKRERANRFVSAALRLITSQ